MVLYCQLCMINTNDLVLRQFHALKEPNCKTIQTMSENSLMRSIILLDNIPHGR